MFRYGAYDHLLLDLFQSQSNIKYHTAKYCEEKVLYNSQFLGHRELPDSLVDACDKRKVEFCVGRQCASRALQALHCSSSDIGMSPEGIPIWPDSISGSISHSNGSVVAVAMKKGMFKSIGVDLEEIVPAKVAEECFDIVATEPEIRLLEESSVNRDQAFTLIFSSKESIYKCLFPIVGQYFDFKDIALTGFDIDKRALRFNVMTDLHERVTANTGVTVDWKPFGSKIVTTALF